MKNRLNILFLVLCGLCVLLPIIFFNRQANSISVAENRVLAAKPNLFTDNNKINKSFIREFDNWYNDNIGFRDKFVQTNAKIQFNMFDRFENNDMYIGPNGELNYATSYMLTSYAHLDLMSEEELDDIKVSYQIINNWLEKQGIQFYVYQCYDKHSIYPEYFPNGINQYGNRSKTDQIINTLQNDTDINVISPKQALLEAKNEYSVYGKWSDPTHWTQRGAYIGYLQLMNYINSKNNNNYICLNENDYNITEVDFGNNLYNAIHNIDYEENFEIKNPKAVLDKSKLTYLPGDKRHKYYINNSVQNNTRALIVGDSYFNIFIIDDIAESFNETILLWGDYTNCIREMIKVYHPDIVIFESAERCNRNILLKGLSDNLIAK